MTDIVYVLECKNNHYYVDVSERKRLIKRLRQHRDGKRSGCVWTKRHPALKLISYTTLKYKNQPTIETEKWMKAKGMNHVRGGDYQTLKLNKDDIRRIQRKFKFKPNACWKCGRLGHVITNCSSTSYYNGESFTSDDEEEEYNESGSSGYTYTTEEVDNIPTPGMTWHSIPP